MCAMLDMESCQETIQIKFADAQAIRDEVTQDTSRPSDNEEYNYASKGADN